MEVQQGVRICGVEMHVRYARRGDKDVKDNGHEGRKEG